MDACTDPRMSKAACVSSLCVVPVTLTLSNCSSAPVDVLIDLRHKSPRYVCVATGNADRIKEAWL